MNDEVAGLARQFFGVDEKLKILAISSDGARVYAVYDGERLVVTHVLMSSQGHRSPEVINEVFAKKGRGFACIIEGKNEYLARQAIQFPFDDANQTEAMLSNALGLYCFMLEIGNILVEPGCRQHLIAPSDENLKRTGLAEGRMTYSVDWAALTGGQRAILLCVIGIGFELVREWRVESTIRRRLLAKPHQALFRALFLRWPEKVSSVEPPAEIIIPRIRRWRRRGLRFGRPYTR